MSNRLIGQYRIAEQVLERSVKGRPDPAAQCRIAQWWVAKLVKGIVNTTCNTDERIGERSIKIE
jgi:hypothetical protein